MNPNNHTKNTASSAHLGIDISKLHFDAYLQLEEDSHHAQFTNNPAGFGKLDAWLKTRHTSSLLAGIEATGPYGQALLHHLHQQGHQVAELNPRHVKDFGRSLGRRVKTDALDAKVIAQFIQAVPPALWKPVPLAFNELRQLVRHRHQVQSKAQVVSNQLGSHIDQGPGASPHVTLSLQHELAFYRSAVEQAEQAIEDWIRAHPELRKTIDLLRTIPGVGTVVATTILAEIPHLRALPGARQAAAFAGLTPLVEESGTSVRRRGSMSKQGSALLRKQLYMAALNVVRRDNALRPVYEALVARGKAKMCAMGAIMHKLLRIAYGVLKSGKPFSPERLQKAF